jgi:CheY-like chemotaxis protein
MNGDEESSRRAGAGETPRVLLVDDDESFRQVMIRRLTHRGITVEEAATGEAALDRLGSESFDVVVLDVKMPGMGGIETLHRIQRLRFPVEVILLTGHYTVQEGVAVLVGFGLLNWDDIHRNLEWGTALFIFGGGISLGLAMGASGAADYFAHLFFPYVKGGGWLLLFAGVGVFGAIVTNAMANVAAAALILPIVIPMAQLEGVDPRVLALCLGMATSFAMLLVIGCPPNAIAYSYRYFKSSDLTKVGLVATPVLLGILILVSSVWWKILGLV